VPRKPQKPPEAWELAFREEVRRLAPKSGLTVARSVRGRVELKLRRDGRQQSAVLPFAWTKDDWGDANARIRNVFKYLAEGHSLAAACTYAEGKAPKRSDAWSKAAEAFEVDKRQHGRAVSAATYDKQYRPVVDMAVGLLGSRTPPVSPSDLIDMCIRAWTPGSRTRQQRAQALASFLTFSVRNQHFPDVWLPPADLRHHIGDKQKEALSHKGDHFDNDQQILNLIASMPTEEGTDRDREAAERWVNALQLMAVFGLRPVEVGSLKVQIDPTTGEKFFWCTWVKRAGGGSTKPRRLYPLPLHDMDGNRVDWNLVERFDAGLLPLPEPRENKWGEAFNTYLNRRPAWVSLKAVMKETRGKRILPYSFRHTYSLRGHVLGIDSGSMALAMGHSLDSHLRAYPYASADTTKAAFAKVTSQPTRLSTLT